MNKKFTFFVFFIAGIASFASAADQVFFELNYGVWFYPGFGGKIGWEHYWDNEKIGLIADVSYYNNGFVDELEGDWREQIKVAHNFGLAAGVVFNNMGFNGVLRTSEYIKLKGLWQTYSNFLPVAPVVDLGFKLDVFFAGKTAVSAGIGLEMTWIVYPYWYASVGMKFTL